MSEVFETTDMDAAEHLLASTYGSMRITARGRRTGMRLAQDWLGPVRLDRVSLQMSFHVDASPHSTLVFGELKSGLVRHVSAGTERFRRPGQVFLAAQPGDPYAATVADTEVEVAIVDPALLSQVADGEPGRARQPVRFTGYEPVSRQAAQQWRSAYAYFRDTILTSPDAGAQPLVTSSAARLLVATALTVFPHNGVADPTSEDRHDAHPATLRRAIAYIDEHAHEDITIAGIAAAAFVTIRAIQLAFRRHLGTTPMAYLRRVRLTYAHRDLIAADPSHATVTQIAYRWGFPTPSRFTALYRQAYGVTPSYSLHQR